LDEFFDEVERLRRLTRDEALGPGSWAAAAATWVECGAMRRARCLHLTLPGDLLQEAEADAGRLRKARGTARRRGRPLLPSLARPQAPRGAVTGCSAVTVRAV